MTDQPDLYLGDCRSILSGIGKVDAVITDPPYANGTQYNGFADTELALGSLIASVMPWILENSKSALITPGNGNQWAYPRPDWTLAWITPAGVGSGPWGFSCWQPILAYGSCPYLASGQGRRPDIFIHTEKSEINGHLCPKPLGLMKKLVERATLPGQTILDPFMGSGTTGVAAISLGRKFIGIEMNAEYFNIACKKIAEATWQDGLFDRQKPVELQCEMF